MLRHLLVSAIILHSSMSAQQADDPTQLARALNRFGAQLHLRVGRAEQNLAFAPASVALALLLTESGARNDTAAELQQLLCPTGWDSARTRAAAAALLARLRKPQAKTELAIVNDLWPARGHALLPEYVAALRQAFDVELRPLDFAGATSAARKTINDHVAKATKDRIQDLLPPDAVHADTRLILTNAVYFRSLWRNPFDAASTQDRSFTLADGTQVKVPTMGGRSRYPIAETDQFQVLRLDYVHPDLCFDVLLPRAGVPLRACESALTAAGDADWSAQLAVRDVQVALPRFRVEGSFRLREALRDVGLKNATTAMVADFSGIDGGKGKLFIEEAVHKTFLEVGEEGTEAAAATAIVMKAGSAPKPEQPIRFTADHPFAFALRDRVTGLVLFSGRVFDPRATKS